GSVESNDIIFNAGYNYTITRKDTLGLSYQFSAYHYLDQPQAIGDHSIQFSYGRKVTGRLGLRLFGGVEITTFRIAVGGDTGRTAGTASADLSYALHRFNIDFNYIHGVTGGSGVFLGATTDQFQLNAGRQLTQRWSGNIRFGVAYNRSIVSGTNGASS